VINTHCPRCKGELQSEPQGFAWCPPCGLSIPREGEVACIEARGKKVHDLVGKILAATTLLEKDGHGSQAEVLIALLVATGFLCRRRYVRIDPGIPAGLQLPPLLAGWELAHEAQEAQERADAGKAN
jgi:hypothetical protein